MELIILACAFAAYPLVISGAPTYTESEEAQLAKQYSEDYQYLREPRSKIPLQYVTPCAAAAAAAAALHRPSYVSPYNYNMNRFQPSQYGYGVPHYRSVEEQMAEPEMLLFSDTDQIQHDQAMMMDHNPMARFGAALPPISPVSSGYALNGPALTSVSGPAYGIFPNANVGGCDVPLLFSCSPSISSGRIIESRGHISPVTGNSYRLAEEQRHLEQSIQEPLESQEKMEKQTNPVHKTSHLQQTRA
ncbi:unnamed protein product [Arctia plantaginis]|uniref:Uncharacterized protein n=1 Tax=Arctia plantaginis TaxID=874455 RepID=A0A8S1BC50_ARCPL|nr:unnamed protein product [Arctia plantaginis]